ncbi:hypothetical protein Z043_119148, partial [Scleropages formosus]
MKKRSYVKSLFQSSENLTVDHWNNERERVVMITDNTLVICKYDFMMFNCEQILKVPLNFVDRVSHGAFVFPPRSLL